MQSNQILSYFDQKKGIGAQKKRMAQAMRFSVVGLSYKATTSYAGGDKNL